MKFDSLDAKAKLEPEQVVELIKYAEDKWMDSENKVNLKINDLCNIGASLGSKYLKLNLKLNQKDKLNEVKNRIEMLPEVRECLIIAQRGIWAIVEFDVDWREYIDKETFIKEQITDTTELRNFVNNLYNNV